MSVSFPFSLVVVSILLLFIGSVESVVSSVKSAEVKNVTYHSFPHSDVGDKEKRWTYLTLMPGQAVEVRYISIDYFAIEAMVIGVMGIDDERSTGVDVMGIDVILQRGLQFQREERDPRTGMRRDLLRCRNETSCSERMRLRYADYILRFSNPTMHTKHVRYSVEVRDDTTSLMAQAILLFFIAGVVCPLVTVSLLILICYIKAQQYLMYYREGMKKRR